eukprot:4859113-Pleurochrysis_carterae.AAC.1
MTPTRNDRRILLPPHVERRDCRGKECIGRGGHAAEGGESRPESLRDEMDVSRRVRKRFRARGVAEDASEVG